MPQEGLCLFGAVFNLVTFLTPHRGHGIETTTIHTNCLEGNSNRVGNIYSPANLPDSCHMRSILVKAPG